MSWNTKMADYFTGDCKHLGSVHQDDSKLRSYRFGRRHERHGRGLSALHHANSYLKALIQSMADAKFRRMVCELELRGARAWICGMSCGLLMRCVTANQRNRSGCHGTEPSHLDHRRLSLPEDNFRIANVSIPILLRA